MSRKKRRALSVLEAVDNLSNLAELDVEKKNDTEWLDPSKKKYNEEKVRETFEALNHYLRHLYQKERAELNDPNTQRGIQAMMQLASEAVDKMGKFSGIFKEAVAAEEPIPEYQQLQQFYLSKIVSKVKKEGKEAWEKEIQSAEEAELDIERQALKDLETVRADREYELFYIYKEDGMPFFNPNLLRHVRLVGNFDETISPVESDSPLMRMDVVLDRDLHLSARQILEELGSHLQDYFHDAMKYKDNECVGALNKAAMALMLAANPRNLIHNASGKSASGYFIDFQTYLRVALTSEEYRKWIHTPIEKLDSFSRHGLKITHLLCGLLFLRTGAHNDILSFIKKLAEKSEKNLPSFWGTLMGFDEAIRDELRDLPSGPLLKILQAFREGEEKEGYDPIIQHNPPSQIFALSTESMHITFLHLPSPTRQAYIDRAEIVPEFYGYLRYLSGKKHLLINLQDATSWREHTRCRKLEELPKTAALEESLEVLTLAKNTDFYHQTQDYAHLNDTHQFLKQFEEQLQGGVQCGFYLPAFPLKPLDLLQFVHTQFFEGKASLNRKERLDFIEIFYFFYLLLLLDKNRCDSVSFTCKDGVDTGAAAAAFFFGFARMLSTEAPWHQEDRDFFLYALYAPGLLVRHRAIESLRLQRTISALEHVDNAFKSRRSAILRACAELMPDLPIGKIKVSEVA